MFEEFSSPLEKQVVCAVNKVIKRFRDEVRIQPFENYAEVVKYLLDNFNILMAAKKLFFSNGKGVLTFFNKFSPSKLVHLVTNDSNIPYVKDMLDHFALVFPLEGQLMVVTNVPIQTTRHQFPKIVLPKGMTVYYLSDFFGMLLGTDALVEEDEE